MLSVRIQSARSPYALRSERNWRKSLGVTTGTGEREARFVQVDEQADVVVSTPAGRPVMPTRPKRIAKEPTRSSLIPGASST